MNDEADDLVREERVAQVLRRRARDLRVPPFAEVEARMRRATPTRLPIAAGVVLVVLGLVVGSALADRRAAAPGAPPSAVVTTGAPITPTIGTGADSVPGASVLSDRFGFVWTKEPLGVPPGVRVSPEADGDGFQAASSLPQDFPWCGCAVSPDGTRIAYWTNMNRLGNVEMRIMEVGRPTPHTTIYRPPADQQFAGATWSSDGTGIVFALKVPRPPGGPDSGPVSSSLWVIEAGGGAARKLDDRGAVYVPLGWDRQAGVAAAAITGPGGYVREYLTVRTSGPAIARRTDIPEDVLVLSVGASGDQRYVAAVFLAASGSTLRWWRLTDFATIVTGPRVEERARARWRPGTTEIAWIEGAALQLLDVERNARATGGVAPAGAEHIAAFRNDGSAVLVSTTQATTYVLLEINSGRSASITSTAKPVGAVRFR